MRGVLPLSADQRAFFLLLTAAWTLAGITLYLLAPRTAPALLPLCLVAPLAWHWTTMRRVPWRQPSSVIVVLVLAGLYLLVNGTWSLSPAFAYFEIAWLFFFIAALHATLNTLRDTETAVVRAMAIGFYAAMLLGGAFLCFEAFSQLAVRRLLISYVPSLRPQRWNAAVEPYLLNRSMTALVLLFWPAALVVTRLDTTRRKQTLLLLGLGLVAAAIFRSHHATSKIAFLGAAATYGVFRASPALMRRLTIAGWVAMTLLVVPMAAITYSSQVHLANWLPSSAQQRLVIWGYTSEQVAKAPVLGAGMSTARALDNPDDFDAPRAPGTDFRLTTSLHSHNAYLQVWYETGAVGALILLGLGLLVLRSLANAASDVQPYLYATFVSCALVGATSFSLWAPWFMASFGLAAVFAALASELAARCAGNTIRTNL
jgi:O-antigen ligase